MKVLVVNKFWYRRGGLERVMFDEISWLEAAGHQVAHFSTGHPSNDSSPWASYFIPYLELGEQGRLSVAESLRAVGNMFYNTSAARRFDALIGRFEPDVIHIHGIHRQLSTSILGPARRRGIPVVQTLHDYHHVCPCDTLLRRGRVQCMPRRCGKLWYGAAAGNRCVRGSFANSALSAAETSFARITRAYERGVARFIAPSRFLADSMVSGGWTIPIDLIPNAVPVQPTRDGIGEAVVYLGRLSPEKGLKIALDAARLAQVKLVVAGEGPMGDSLRAEYPEAEFVGHLSGIDTETLLRRARTVVIPSLWFENAPMAVLEAMAQGVPVVASRVGGIPEQISDGVDGVLVEPGDAKALAVALASLSSNPDWASTLGVAARESVTSRFTPAKHVHDLLASYGRALNV